MYFFYFIAIIMKQVYCLASMFVPPYDARLASILKGIPASITELNLGINDLELKSRAEPAVIIQAY
jgi:hypothetical protein